jgi:peptidyl-prolyl cis-trans isomerase SurA
MVDRYAFKDKTAEFTPSDEYPIIIAVGKVITAPQVYTDVRGQVTNDYQDYLEKQWVATLREKYPVVINQEVLSILQ